MDNDQNGKIHGDVDKHKVHPVPLAIAPALLRVLQPGVDGCAPGRGSVGSQGFVEHGHFSNS